MDREAGRTAYRTQARDLSIRMGKMAAIRKITIAAVIMVAAMLAPITVRTAGREPARAREPVAQAAEADDNVWTKSPQVRQENKQ